MALDKDVILNKKAIIERCTKRINEEFDQNAANLKNFTKQDSIVLNLQRACEAAIDLAMHTCTKLKLGVPQSSSDAFKKLLENEIITACLEKNLKGMVGFRNIAVHDYQTLNLNILESIINHHLKDLLAVSNIILSLID